MPRKSRWRGSSLSVVVAGSRGTTAGSFQRNWSTGFAHSAGSHAALLQEPGRVGVLEAVDRVAEDDVVARVEVRELVVVVAGLAAVGQHLVEVGRPHVAEDGPARGGVLAGRGPAHLGHHRERRPGDAHVVGRLVVGRRPGSRARSARGGCRTRATPARAAARRGPPPRGGPRPRPARRRRGPAPARCGCGTRPGPGPASDGRASICSAPATRSAATASLRAASKPG